MLTSLQALLRLATLRWLGVFVCALATLLAAANTASAHEPTQTKTRVWGFDFAEHNSVGLFRAASSGKHQGNCSAGAEEASDSLLAARGAERAGAALSKTEVAGLRDLFGKSTKGAQELLGRLRGGEAVPLPPGVTPQTLQTYRGVAENAIQAGKDTLGVQAARKEAIDLLLKAGGP